jgi:D-threo-aldose 1-dehydrogenase
LAEFDPRGQAIVSTKVGRRLEPIAGAGAPVRHGFADAAPFEPVFDYSYDGVMRAFEDSRRRLRRERIDMLLVHDLGAMTHGEAHSARWSEFRDGGYRALRALRDGGAVAAIGLGVNEWQIAEAALDQLDFDVVLLAGRYTLLEQGALRSFLPLCAARGVSVIVGGPYNSGILAQARDARPARYNYDDAPAAVVERVRRLADVCDAFDTPLAAAALQFPLAHPQVRCVIPGMANADEVAQASANLRRRVPAGLWAALRDEGLLDAEAPVPAAAVEDDNGALPVILLNPKDNVLVCRRPIAAGERLIIDNMMLAAPMDIAMGHKLARRPLAPGDKVFKHGAPIGSMTALVARGGHVHLHNMCSDYIASHTRDAVGAGEDEGGSR